MVYLIQNSDLFVRIWAYMLNDSISPLCSIFNRVIFYSPHILNENTCKVPSTVDANEWRLYYLASLEI